MRGILIILLLPIWSFAQVSDATIKTNTNTNIRNASTVTRANHAAINDQLTDAKSSRIEAVTLAGTNTYTVNIAWVGSYQSGLNFLATFVNANSGVSTINVNSLGAKTLKKFSGGSKVDLASGDISAGQIYQLVYDGTFFKYLFRARVAVELGEALQEHYQAKQIYKARLMQRLLRLGAF